MTQTVLFVGQTVLGAKHDYKMLQDEFPPSMPWFEKLSVWIDLGYIGFEKDYEEQKQYYNGKKKPIQLRIP